MKDVMIINLVNGSQMVFTNSKRDYNYQYDSTTIYLDAEDTRFRIPYTSILYIEFKDYDDVKLYEYKENGIPMYNLKKGAAHI